MIATQHQALDPLLSIDQTKAALNVKARSTIYEFIKAGHLKPVKIGRLTRFKASDVARLIANGTASA